MKRRISIRMKLIGAFLMMAALIVGSTVLALAAFGTVSGNITELIDRHVPTADYSMELQINLADQKDGFTDYTLTRDPQVRQDALQAGKEFRDGAAKLRILLPSAQQANLDIVMDLQADFERLGSEMDALVDSGQEDEARVKMADFDSRSEEVVKLLSALEEFSKEGMAHSTRASYDAMDGARNLLLAFGVVAALVAVALGLGMSLPMSTSAKQVANAADGIASGDLQQKVEVRSQDELGDMAGSFQHMIAYLQEMADVASAIATGDLTRNVQAKSEKDVLGNAFSLMIHNLRDLVRQVMASAEAVSASSDQLSQSAGQAGEATQQIAGTIQQVAQGTQIQSEATVNASSSLQQLRQAIEQIARGAQEQSGAIQTTSAIVARTSASINKVSRGSEAVSLSAGKAQEAARGAPRPWNAPCTAWRASTARSTYPPSG